jgi:hypothetical protein
MIEIKQHFQRFVIGLALCMQCYGPLYGDETSDYCSQEALIANFPPTILQETLVQFQIPPEKWEVIRKELIDKDRDFVKELESRASKMSQNPLQDAQQRQTAIKLFRETLYDSFAEVMKAHGIDDAEKIQQMLDDIQMRKARAFGRCFKAQAPSTGRSPSPPPSQ